MRKFSVILIAILASVSYQFYASEANGASEANSAKTSSAVPAKSVDSQIIHLQTITPTKSVPGRVTAFRDAQVRPQVDGIIVKRLFEEGSRVEKGQQLYQIDDLKYQAQLNRAKAGVQSANANFKAVKAKMKRFEHLVENQTVSQQDYDNALAEESQAQADIEIAKAEVALAQVELNYTKVYAPISGQIGRSLITEGGLVSVNQTQALAHITQLDPVYIDVKQSQKNAYKIQQKLLQANHDIQLTVTLDTLFEPKVLTGQVKFAEFSIDQSTDSVMFRGIVDNPEFTLLPGAFITANIELNEREVVLLPQSASIRKANGELEVWVIDENSKAYPKEVQVESTYKDTWIISSGLNAGDEIIVKGYQKLAPGDLVSTQ